MHNSPVGGNMSAMTPRLRTLIDHASRLAESDAVLLRRFADARDPQAFAELVRRYGRLVWGQCRHLLHSEADADDAFQATFLTLAKSARTLRDTNKLGPWLHGIAYRVCQQVMRTAARRTKREKATAKAEAARPVPDSAWDQAFAAVHDELAKLPDTLRVPFVLCVLEGKGTSEAAAQLGLKLGTLSARLSRAKQTLLDRLTARGLTAGLAAVGAVAVGASNAPAAVVGRACDLAAGGAVPANILSLSHGVLNMVTQGAKRWAMAVLLGCGLVAGVGGVWQANAQDKPAVDKARDKAEALKKVLVPDDPELKKAEDDLKRLEAEALQKRVDATKALDALEKARQEAEVMEARVRLANELAKPLPEFKYDVKGPEYKPTTTEFEKAVKDGEQGGFTFVGVVTFDGFTEKSGKGPVQALVFRRTPPPADAVKKVRRELEDVLNNQKSGPHSVPRLPADPNLVAPPLSEELKLQAEIERLNKQLTELKGKAFRGDVVFFPLAHLAVEDFDAGAKLLAGLLRLKYGADGLKAVEITRAPAGGVLVKGLSAEGNAVAQWLFEQVKQFRETKSGK